MLTRMSGLTAPTVSKAVDSLLRCGLLEELDPLEQALGRPGRLVRMAAAGEKRDPGEFLVKQQGRFRNRKRPSALSC